jgi:hypothetical protein
MHKLTNKDAWLQLFSTNDTALIAAITLCRRFGPDTLELTEAEADYIEKQKRWLYETADNNLVAIVDRKINTISVQEYNEKVYPMINKAECFVANLNHALDKSDDNAKMQCRVVGWDEETKELLQLLLAKYREDIKKTIR